MLEIDFCFLILKGGVVQTVFMAWMYHQGRLGCCSCCTHQERKKERERERERQPMQCNVFVFFSPSCGSSRTLNVLFLLRHWLIGSVWLAPVYPLNHSLSLSLYFSLHNNPEAYSITPEPPYLSRLPTLLPSQRLKVYVWSQSVSD